MLVNVAHGHHLLANTSWRGQTDAGGALAADACSRTSIMNRPTYLCARCCVIASQGLEHWRDRLTSDVNRLVSDIEAAEALAERWCGKCSDGLHELRLLHDKKQQDLEQVLKAIGDIQHDLGCAATVAEEPGVAPLLLVPRRTGHPSQPNTLLRSVKSPPSTLYSGARTPVHNTREMSRKVARQSAILVNSPDPVSKKLLF